MLHIGNSSSGTWSSMLYSAEFMLNIFADFCRQIGVSEQIRGKLEMKPGGLKGGKSSLFVNFLMF